jgi:hypothetical protein
MIEISTEGAIASLSMTCKRLLILSCSQSKRHQDGLLPAIERYDGPLFRVLRRYRKAHDAGTWETEPDPDIYVLSAEFGLIPAERPIPMYEHRMTRQRAQMLRPGVTDELRRLLNGVRRYRDLFICLGQKYWPALEGWETFVSQDMAVFVARGSIGMRQSQLYDWLYGSPPPTSVPSGAGKSKFRGIAIELSTQQVFELARQGLREDNRAATVYQTWYVPVDDQRVAPKWLVSRLTGLPVNVFRTEDARRLLTRLGIEVMRA